MDTEASPPLDWRQVAEALFGARLGHEVVYLTTTASTNDVARQLAVEGAPEGTIVLADAQTAGRGRAGKTPWLTPPRTSVAVSVLLRPPLIPSALPQLGMAAAVAAVAAIRETAGVHSQVKWPNDVVVAAGKLGEIGKLGGVLIESALVGDSVAYAVAGIGLNVNLSAADLGTFPDAALPPATVQDVAGRPVSREALLVALLRELARLYDQLCAGDATEVWRRYRDALDSLGQAVRIHAAGAPVKGTVETVTADGALVVRLPSGARRTFTYGDVTLRSDGAGAKSRERERGSDQEPVRTRQ